MRFTFTLDHDDEKVMELIEQGLLAARRWCTVGDILPSVNVIGQVDIPTLVLYGDGVGIAPAGEGEGPYPNLNKWSVKSGLYKWAEEDPQSFIRYLSDDWYASDADLFMQYTLIGDIKHKWEE